MGGPFVSAGALGYLAATAAKKGKGIDSETGRNAATVAAGIAGGVGGLLLGVIGAPFVGIGAAMTTSYKLKGKLENDSPQSSDDEAVEQKKTLIHKVYSFINQDHPTSDE